MIKVGSKVSCRLFNWPEGKFYGERFDGEVICIDFEKDSNNSRLTVDKPYLIRRKESFDIWMNKKEIKEIK